MEKSLQVIDEIKRDATDLQKKLVSIPVPESGDFSKEQATAMLDAQDGLSFWRRAHLGILEKAFSGK